MHKWKWWAWAIVYLAGVAVFVVVAVVTRTAMNHEWWGGLGQWVGAGATFLAVVAALHLGARQSAQDHRARAESEAQRRDMEAAQARLVVITMLTPEWWDVGAKRDDGIGVKVKNYSDRPIRDLELIGFAIPEGVAEGATVAWYLGNDRHDPMEPPPVLEAGGKYVTPVEVAYTPRPDDPNAIEDVPVILFTDHAGNRWTRVGRAQPQRHIGDAPYPIAPRTPPSSPSNPFTP